MEHLGIVWVRLRSEEEVDRLLQVVEALEKRGVWLAVIPSKNIVSRRAIELAAITTIVDFLSGTNRARKPHMNLLLRLTAQTQIKDAFARIKLSPGVVAVVVLREKNAGVTLEDVRRELSKVGLELCEEAWAEAPSDTLLSSYEISPEEVRSLAEIVGSEKEALELLVLERIALAFID